MSRITSSTPARKHQPSTTMDGAFLWQRDSSLLFAIPIHFDTIDLNSATLCTSFLIHYLFYATHVHVFMAEVISVGLQPLGDDTHTTTARWHPVVRLREHEGSEHQKRERGRRELRMLEAVSSLLNQFFEAEMPFSNCLFVTVNCYCAVLCHEPDDEI
jgi:hypothetical protein